MEHLLAACAHANTCTASCETHMTCTLAIWGSILGLDSPVLKEDMDAVQKLGAVAPKDVS